MPFLELYSYDAVRKGVHDDLRVIKGASASLLSRGKLQIFLNRLKDEWHCRPGILTRCSLRRSG